MKNFKLFIFLVLLSSCLMNAQISVQASTLPRTKDVVEDLLPKFNRDTAKEIADRLGLGDLFSSVLDFFDAIEGINDKILETRSPDWNTIKNTIENIDTRSKQLSRQLEDRTTDSYSINQDESEQTQREFIQNSITESTTGENAQKTIAASLVEIEDALKKSGDLSKDSAQTDVSQQILQNISEQSGINTQLLGTIAAQNIQAQEDRANQINLALQEARHKAIETTRHRREAAVANDLGITAWGAISTPLFLYEE